MTVSYRKGALRFHILYSSLITYSWGFLCLTMNILPFQQGYRTESLRTSPVWTFFAFFLARLGAGLGARLVLKIGKNHLKLGTPLTKKDHNSQTALCSKHGSKRLPVLAENLKTVPRPVTAQNHKKMPVTLASLFGRRFEPIGPPQFGYHRPVAADDLRQKA